MLYHSDEIAVQDKNLLIIVGVLALLGWFADICRRILSAYELSLCVASGRVVRLEQEGSNFGELQMRWT